MQRFCRKCKRELNDQNLSPSRKRKHDWICRDCHSKESRNWAKQNRKKYLVRLRSWRNQNAEKVKLLNKKYRRTHQEQFKEYQRNWKRKHPDYFKTDYWRKKFREYSKRHPEIKRISEAKRRRKLQTKKILNKIFPNSELHHMGKGIAIYLPKELHHSIRHSLLRNENMEKINTLALLWLNWGKKYEKEKMDRKTDKREDKGYPE